MTPCPISFASPTMSTSPGLFAGLTAVEIIAQEQEHQAAELPAPSALGKRASPSGDADSNGRDDEEPLSPGRENSQSHSILVTHPNPGMLQMEQTIRRMAKWLKLLNENISLVEQFYQVSITSLALEIDNQ